MDRFSGWTSNAGELLYLLAHGKYGTSVRFGATQEKQASPHDELVSVIPAWAGTWSPALLMAGGLVLLFAGVTGARDGAPWGWTMLFAIATAVAATWVWDDLRRVRQSQERLDQALCQQSKFPLIDVMSGEDFERYCARMLPGLGYRYVDWIGGPGNGGVDILATDHNGVDVAVLCKRSRRSIGPWAIHQVRGAVAGGGHARRQPILMTNARVTPRGWEAAKEANVRVTARQELGYAMWQVRNKTHSEAILKGHDGNDSPDSPRPGTSQRFCPRP